MTIEEIQQKSEKREQIKSSMPEYLQKDQAMEKESNIVHVVDRTLADGSSFTGFMEGGYATGEGTKIWFSGARHSGTFV